MIDVRKFSNVDLYGLLGVKNTATENEIRTAYQAKVQVLHPEKNPEAGEVVHKLIEAVRVLTNDPARATYDRILKNKKILVDKQRGPDPPIGFDEIISDLKLQLQFYDKAFIFLLVLFFIAMAVSISLVYYFL